MRTVAGGPVMGIDVGGSSVKSAVVDCSKGTLLGARREDAVEGILSPDQLKGIVTRVRSHCHWEGPVGLAFPGRVMAGVISLAGNVSPEFDGLDLPGWLRECCGGVPIVLNDADAAGMAERHFGTGIGTDGFSVFLTLGTGVGSALFYDGRLIPNAELGLLEFEGRLADDSIAASAIAHEQLTIQQWAVRLNRFLRLLDRLLAPNSVVIGGAISSTFSEWSGNIEMTNRVTPATHFNSAGLVGAAMAAVILR